MKVGNKWIIATIYKYNNNNIKIDNKGGIDTFLLQKVSDQLQSITKNYNFVSNLSQSIRTLSSNREAVLGALQSTWCLTHRSSNCFLDSGRSNFVGCGSLAPVAFSKSGNIRSRLKGGVKSISNAGPVGPSG